MDSALLDMTRSGGRNKIWAETMVNLEARKLIGTANQLSVTHLQDSLTRIQFTQEIKAVIEEQFAVARHAKSDEECMECVNILRKETENLQQQGRMLRMKTAKLYAKVEFIRENNNIVGYVISAVHIVVSGSALVGGMIMMSTMSPVGILAGAILFVDGINGITKAASHLRYGKQNNSEGIFADGFMEIAKYKGFKPESGLATYNVITLGASAYSILGLTRNAGAWRLFRWLPRDYSRRIETMSRPKLTMKIVGYGVKAKVIFDLLTTEYND